MEPDVDPPLLPLQGVRLRRPLASSDASPAPLRTKSSSYRNARPAPKRPQQSSQRGDVSRLPASARPATRVASHAKRPSTASRSAVRNSPIKEPAPVPTKPQPFQRTRAPVPARTSRTIPLLPLSGRKPGQNAPLARARTNSELERWDITPDGGSAGREGRRFAVSNVGNNGRIYLRCVSVQLGTALEYPRAPWRVWSRKAAGGNECFG